MAASNQCARCGAALDPGRTQCPECLLLLGLSDGVSAATGPDGLPFPAALRAFGDFELLGEIARGGMGVVFKARQNSLNRIVAVKMILAGHFAGPESIRRFRAEAEVAARLRHPHIIAVHEIGEQDGQHYFSMDYIQGRNLAEVVREKPMAARRAAALMRTVAEAIDCAHGQGVLHRDIKPSNIILDAEDRPHVTDFGLAKQWVAADGTGDLPPPETPGLPTVATTEITLTGQVLGSPNYISPEQASGKRGVVGPASDVYALGAVLCHLVTGRAPFIGETLTEILEQVLHHDPVSPRLLNPAVPRDLETICLKCLEKEPARRYPSARELAEELGRFLGGEPIRARPLSAVGKAWRWCGRKPVVAALSAAFVLAVALGVAGVIWQKDRAQRNLVRQYVANGTRLMNEGDFFGSLLWYTEALKMDAGSRPREEPHRIRIATVLGECPKLLHLFSHGTTVFGAEFSPQGDALVTASDDHTARVWDLVSGELRYTLVHSGDVHCASFSRDGGRVVTASRDGTARVWAARLGNPVLPPFRHPKAVWHASFDPDGGRLATVCDDNCVRVWNAQTGELLLPPLRLDQAPIRAIFSPDGRLLQIDTYFNLSLWDVATGRPVLTNLTHDGGAAPAAFSPDGKLLLTHSATLSTILDLDLGGRVIGSVSDQYWTDLAAFSPDGGRILTCDRRRGICLWDVRTRRPLFPTTSGSSDATGAFSPDGSCVVTGGRDRTARVWDAETGKPLTPKLRHPGVVTKVQFHPDGHRFFTVAGQSSVRVWDLATGGPTHHLAKPVVAADHRFLDGPRRRSFLSGESNVLWLRDVVTGQKLSRPMPHSDEILASWFDPEDRMILTSCGQFIKPGKWEASIALWDTNGLRLNQRDMKQDNEFMSAAFNRDRTRLVTSGYSAAHVWEIPSGRPVANLNHGAWVISVGFGPGDRTIITIDDEHVIRLWDAATGSPVAWRFQPGKPVSQAILSPKQDRLCVVATDGTVQYWNVPVEEPLTPFLATSEESDAEAAATFRLSYDAYPVDDLTALARLYSGSFVDQGGNAREIPVNVLTNEIADLKRKYPDQFAGRSRDVIEWRKKRIHAAEAIGLPAVARSHLRQLREIAGVSPADLQFCRAEEAWLAAGEDSRARRRWVERRAGPRDPRCPPEAIDLTEHFSYALRDGDHPGHEYEGITPGLVNLGGVNLDVRGAIELGRNGVPNPERLAGIRIGRKCRRLHFLQQTSVESAAGTLVGRYILRYADGASHELPIVYGKHLVNGWIWHDFELALSDAKIVWVGGSPRARQEGYSLCLALSTYENPRPDVEIVTMDFVSEMTVSSPVLVALTVE